MLFGSGTKPETDRRPAAGGRGEPLLDEVLQPDRGLALRAISGRSFGRSGPEFLRRVSHGGYAGPRSL
ncbi:MAG TPA: hypothetical protein VGP38_03805 [Rubrobacter sp.]|nr:hypothetical protein [Rubrobacter sp.]